MAHNVYTRPIRNRPARGSRLSGRNFVNTDRNPLLNAISVPTGQIYYGGRPDPPGFGSGTAGQYGNVRKTFQRMANNMPVQGAYRTLGAQATVGQTPVEQSARSGSVLPYAGNVSPETTAAMNRDAQQITAQDYAKNRISLLRKPITTEGPQLQLTSQVGSAEQLRDLEALSNLYYQNLYTGRNQGMDRLVSVLRLLG